MRSLGVAALALTGCIGVSPVDSAPPCGGGETCSLLTLEAVAECGEGALGLAARSDSPGTIAVVHQAAGTGCCPQVDVEASAWLDLGELRVAYTVGGDDCDCACSVDFRYVLGGVPPGPWTVVTPDGTAARVEVF